MESSTETQNEANREAAEFSKSRAKQRHVELHLQVQLRSQQSSRVMLYETGHVIATQDKSIEKFSSTRKPPGSIVPEVDVDVYTQVKVSSLSS